MKIGKVSIRTSLFVILVLVIASFVFVILLMNSKKMRVVATGYQKYRVEDTVIYREGIGPEIFPDVFDRGEGVAVIKVSEKYRYPSPGGHIRALAVIDVANKMKIWRRRNPQKKIIGIIEIGKIGQRGGFGAEEDLYATPGILIFYTKKD